MPDYYESPPPCSRAEPARLGMQPLVTSLWFLGSLLVTVAIVVAAVQGKKVAEQRLPVREDIIAFAPEALIRVRGSSEVPLVLATEQQGLREYFFRESSISGTGLEGIADGSVFEYRGELGLRVLAADSDLIHVEVVEGARVTERFWMLQPMVGQIEADVEESP